MKYRYPRLNAEMPSKEDVLKLTPNSAVGELARRLAEEGVETYLDRFAAHRVPGCLYPVYKQHHQLEALLNGGHTVRLEPPGPYYLTS